MPWRFPLASLVGLSLIAACAGPGGGKSGVNCALTPTAPACQDASGGDALGGDDATVTPPGCTEHLRRCDGDQPQQCSGGQWTDLTACATGQTCEGGFCDGTAVCSCEGKSCGGDGCGGSCGTCSGQTTCEAGQCVASTACSCDGAVCGFDGCGNPCGTCTGGRVCDQGQCVTSQTCSCDGAQCGFDNCGGACGSLGGGCPSGQTCSGGQCTSSQTCSCNGAVCGFDNCGNPCGGLGGGCPSGQSCSAGQCFGGSTGGDTCGGIVDCIVDVCYPIPDEAQEAACEQTCVSGGSAAAQSQFNAYKSCLDGCETPGCVFSTCAVPQAQCIFQATGSKNCTALDQCLGTDNCDETCAVQCYETATLNAQAQYLGLNRCVGFVIDTASDNCPSCTPGSSDYEDCVVDCAIGSCQDYMDACFGP